MGRPRKQFKKEIIHDKQIKKKQMLNHRYFALWKFSRKITCKEISQNTGIALYSLQNYENRASISYDSLVTLCEYMRNYDAQHPEYAQWNDTLKQIALIDNAEK